MFICLLLQYIQYVVRRFEDNDDEMDSDWNFTIEIKMSNKRI